MESVSPFIMIGFGISILAALSAFLITYEEWSHHYAGRREPLKSASEAAVVAFVVFLVLTFLANAFVEQFLQQ